MHIRVLKRRLGTSNFKIGKCVFFAYSKIAQNLSYRFFFLIFAVDDLSVRMCNAEQGNDFKKNRTVSLSQSNTRKSNM